MIRRQVLTGDLLDRAVALREAGWSFARIGAELGCSEAGASNAVIAEQARREGRRVALRDDKGRLLPEEMERLRLLLKKGVKPIEIQKAMGISASRIAEERRRYNRDLAERGKAPLPPPGNGERYSGARIPRERIREVERLWLEGYGNKKISERTGISLTHARRIRERLVRRLKRRGECLPGCDIDGVRHVQKESTRFIPPETKAMLLELLQRRIPVRRAAKMAGMGSCSAYKLRDQWKAEGIEIPAPHLPGRVKSEFHPARQAGWLPDGYQNMIRYRALIAQHGEPEARRILKAEIAAEKARPLTFEEQLERVRAGAGIVSKIDIRKAPTAFTLGGVASAACAEAAR